MQFNVESSHHHYNVKTTLQQTYFSFLNIVGVTCTMVLIKIIIVLHVGLVIKCLYVAHCPATSNGMSEDQEGLAVTTWQTNTTHRQTNNSCNTGHKLLTIWTNLNQQRHYSSKFHQVHVWHGCITITIQSIHPQWLLQQWCCLSAGVISVTILVSFLAMVSGKGYWLQEVCWFWKIWINAFISKVPIQIGYSLWVCSMYIQNLNIFINHTPYMPVVGVLKNSNLPFIVVCFKTK